MPWHEEGGSRTITVGVSKRYPGESRKVCQPEGKGGFAEKNLSQEKCSKKGGVYMGNGKSMRRDKRGWLKQRMVKRHLRGQKKEDGQAEGKKG